MNLVPSSAGSGCRRPSQVEGEQFVVLRQVIAYEQGEA